jgi:UDP-glucose 4-epimerase
MRVMVTGSKGFLGKSVVARLQDLNHAILHYDIQDGDDILDHERVSSIIQEADLCIHLAAVADLYDAEANADRCRLVNIEGTRVIAEACARSNVQLLFISTVCAYGNNGFEIQTESSPLSPTEIYAETKVEAEIILASTQGLDYRIIRPATFYGSGMRDSLAVQRFIDASMNGRRIEIHGTGKQTRCYTHVDDVASAIVIVAERWTDELVYNVANPCPTSVVDLVKTVREISGAELEIHHVEDRDGQINRSVIDVSRMKSLGWTPRTDLASGIGELLGKEATGNNSNL